MKRLTAIAIIASGVSLAYGQTYYELSGLMPDPVTGQKTFTAPAGKHYVNKTEKNGAEIPTCPSWLDSYTTCPQYTVCPTQPVSWRSKITEGTYKVGRSFDLDLAPYFVNNNETVVTMENIGTDDIIDPWIVVNGADYFSTATIVANIMNGNPDPETIAFRAWSLIKDRRYNWSPSETMTECHSPVKLLNVYGYCLCDDAAQNLACLWSLCGLDSQVRNLSNACMQGHVVPEAFYNDKWHMIDADREVFYPLAAGSKELASVDELHKNAALVERVDRYAIPCYPGYGDYMAHIFSDNYPGKVGNDWDADYDMSMVLRSGESISLCRKNAYGVGKFHDNHNRVEPFFYCNGEHKYHVPLNNTFTHKFSAINIEVVSGAITSPSGGSFTIPVACPYTIVDGVLLLKGNGTVNVSFKRGNSEPQQINGVGLSPYGTPVPLADFISPLNSSAVYRYELIFNLSPSTSITDILITDTIQCSPYGMPLFSGLRNNTVDVRFDMAGPNAVLKVSHSYAISDAWPDVLNSIASETESEVNISNPILKWNGAIGSRTCSVYREVNMYWDPSGEIPVYPRMMASEYRTDSTFHIKPNWIKSGVQYYWGVQEYGYYTNKSPVWPVKIVGTSAADNAWLGVE